MKESKTPPDHSDSHRPPKHAERSVAGRYDQLLDALGEGVSVVDLQETFLFVNPAGTRVFGLEPGDLEGRNLKEFLPQEEVDAITAQTTARATGEISSYETRIIRSDGELRLLSVSATPWRDDDGAVVGSLAVFRDITDQKNTEIALRERVKERETIAAIWTKSESADTVEEFLQFSVDAIPAGFMYPETCCARIVCDNQEFHSAGFAETPRRLDQKIVLDAQRIGTITVSYLREIPGHEVDPFLPEERTLVREAAERIANRIGVDRMRSRLRVQASAMDNASVNVIICDALRGDYPIIYVNREFEFLTGYAAEDVLGRNPRFLHADESRQPGLEEIRAGLAENRPARGILRNYRKDGSAFWCELRIAPVTDEMQRVTTVVGISADVTEVLDARKQLLENEERLRVSQEYANIGSWEWNLLTGEVYWSERMGFLFGHHRGESIVSYEVFIDGVYPEDRPLVEREIQRCIKTGETYNVEHRCRWPDGEVRWLQETGNVTFDENNRPCKMIGVAQDITDRKSDEEMIRNEQDFQEILARIAARFVGVDSSTVDDAINTTLRELGEFFGADGARLFLASADPESGGVASAYVSHQWRRGYGTDPEKSTEEFTAREFSWYYDQLVEKRAIVHIPDVRRLPPEAEREKAFLMDRGIVSLLLIPVFKEHDFFGTIGLASTSNTVYWTETRRQGLSVPAQILSNAFLSIEKRRMLTALKAESDEAREAADKANRAKSEFLSSMSHELRTPLNAVLGFGQLLENDQTLPPEQREFAGEITRAGEHLLALVNEILDLSRIESGSVALSLEPVFCPDVIGETVSLIDPFAGKHGVHLKAIEGDPLTVTADRVRLKQVLLNLLSNAVKYNRTAGTVTVRVNATAQRVRINVTDTGHGIPEEKQKELFTKFSRLGLETGDIEGTGIGLALSKRLMELMNGAIGMESTPGEGSTFWIELPRADNGTDSRRGGRSGQHQHTPQGAPDGTNTPDGTNETAEAILYIEDNPASIRLMESILARHKQYSLVTAHTGTLGLDMAELNHPRLVIVDINLPGIDGFEVLRRIRESTWGKTTPVIALSARAMEDDIRRGMKQGFAAYLTKPLEVSRLLEELDKALGEDR